MDEQTARGVVVGLACGDALGRPVEGWSADRIRRRHGTVDAMLGDGAHGLPAGAVTDDTEMARCLARSLTERDGWDPDDAADRFVAWFRDDPTGIGGMTYRVLSRVAAGEDWERAARDVWERSPEGRNAGNGSLMRCAPVGIAFADDPPRLVDVSMASSRLTHWDPRCTHACAALNLAIAAAAAGDPPVETARDHLLEHTTDPPDTVLGALSDAADADRDPGTLPVSGYVVDTLEAGLGHALAADSFREAVVSAVNNGGDADTVGAVAGAVAGARFGVDEIPAAWLDALEGSETLSRLAVGLTAVDG
ncbi:ADP-ribosylglycohydrolase family protein [Halomicroarcula sp. F13]|uniref:ADP-ribosylglycohydrolase family protein n=1 Tax=Haloarcula rubra TaxID=2487747 RepID=A0AAW4PRK3_9EURY|nr:ADP-ribosylglycohydrolase family protein [Halomicroarcula rubra]MBX0323628.1 ADP-ribosylglycohydrolase family protein [Halomicroarcula rubra]